MTPIEFRFERYPSGLWTLRYWIDLGYEIIYHYFVLDVTEIPLIAGAMVQISAQEANA